MKEIGRAPLGNTLVVTKKRRLSFGRRADGSSLDVDRTPAEA
jgi:hypothetical protein